MSLSNIQIGIISYLPDNEKRKDRLTFARKQFEWLSSLFNTKDIIFVAQNYKSDELMNYHNVILSEGVGPSKARNIILERFYNSDKDFLLQLDDDVLIYNNYYEIENIIFDMDKNPDKFHDIDMITGVFGRFQPFKYLNEDKNLVTNNYVFIPRLINSPGNFIIQRNIKKYYNDSIFYRDINLFKFEGREDMSFLVDFIKRGYRCYQCNQLIIKNLGEVKSCLFDYDEEEHKKQVKMCLDCFLKEHGISRKPNGNVDWASFNKKYNRTFPKLMIKRDIPIQNPNDDWFTVKKRTSKKDTKEKKLF